MTLESETYLMENLQWLSATCFSLKYDMAGSRNNKSSLSLREAEGQGRCSCK